MNANFLRGQISCLHEIVLQCDKKDMAKPAIIVKSPAKTLLRFAFSARSPSPLVNRMENT